MSIFSKIIALSWLLIVFIIEDLSVIDTSCKAAHFWHKVVHEGSIGKGFPFNQFQTYTQYHLKCLVVHQNLKKLKQNFPQMDAVHKKIPVPNNLYGYF